MYPPDTVGGCIRPIFGGKRDHPPVRHYLQKKSAATSPTSIAPSVEQSRRAKRTRPPPAPAATGTASSTAGGATARIRRLCAAWSERFGAYRQMAPLSPLAQRRTSQACSARVLWRKAAPG